MAKKTEHVSCKPDHNMRRVPRVIHQIWLNLVDNDAHGCVPDKYLEMQRSWQIHYPTWTYRCWHNTQANEFMQRHYPQLWHKYAHVAVSIQRVDMLRICVLNVFGGMYADLDTICTRPLTFV